MGAKKCMVSRRADSRTWNGEGEKDRKCLMRSKVELSELSGDNREKGGYHNTSDLYMDITCTYLVACSLSNASGAPDRLTCTMGCGEDCKDDDSAN